MTYTTQPTSRKALFSSRIVTIILASCALFVLQASPAQAQWATNGNNINNTNSGNVGIGISTPNAPLEIYKSHNGGTVVRLDNPDGSSGSAYSGLTMFQNGAARGQITTTNDGCTSCTGGAKALQIWNWLPGNLIFATNAAERMRVDSTGRVGIGTTTPTRMLEVLATDGNAVRAYRNGNGVGWGVNMTFALNNSSGTQVDYAGVHGQVGANTAGAEAGNLVLSTVTSGSLTEKVRVTSAGNVGIGTTTPTSKLHILSADDTVAPALSVRQDNSPTFGFDFTLDNNVNGNLAVNRVNSGVAANVMTFDRSGGTVGIGTSAPVNLLQVGSSSSTAHQYITVDAGAGFQSAIDFRSGGAQKWVIYRPASSSDLRFFDGADNRLVLQNGGNVGIGTASPSTKLHVVGDLTVTGNIAAKYQDVAEWVESSQALPAGTVVVLDRTRSNQVIASSQAYDTRVAGVISSQPGISLGESGAGKVLVATTGRVKVKVDATMGPIQIGDLLVTSEREGLARKSEPLNLGGAQIHRPGTLIGKALEPLEKGVGEILVLLSLQ